MSTQNEPAPIENAEAIIERFGGIRPMATKINVPVTTVQGWKKRNVIPGTRRAEILAAAEQLGLDLSDILSGSTAKVTVHPAVKVPPATPSANENARNQNFSRMVEAKAAEIPLNLGPSIDQKLAQVERRAGLSIAINVLLVLLAIGSVVLMLVPQNQRIAALEGNVQGIQKKQSFLSSLIPDDIEAQIAALRGQFALLDTKFGSVLGKVQKTGEELTSPGGGSLEHRVTQLERNLTDMGNDVGVQIPAMPSSLHGLVSKLESMSSSLGGQEQLNSVTSQLSSLLSSVPADDPAAVDQTLQAAAQQDPQVAQTFEGIPPQDMKAAALLLGMTQFRSTLNRDNAPFAEDLALLKKLAGDDPELQASIDRLAPYAEQGVLTPNGLTQEFKGIAGDVVIASLKGENVSIQDKANARLGEMFQIEKNGEQINGTPTQKTVASANKLLEGGDIEGAVAQMQTLDGPAAIAAQPWINQAQATILAHKFKNLLTQNIGGGGGSIYNSGGPIIQAPRGLNLPSAPTTLSPQQSNIPVYNQQ